MKRRPFLKKIGVGIVGMGVAGSLQPRAEDADVTTTEAPRGILKSHLLKLHLQLENVPQEQHSYYNAICQVAEEVFLDPANTAAFVSNPTAYLEQRGFSGVQIDAASREYRVLLSLSDEKVKEAARSGDVVAFLNALSERSGIAPDMVILVVIPVVAVAVLFFVLLVVYFVVCIFAVDHWGGNVAMLGSSGVADAAVVAAALQGDSFALDVVKEAVKQNLDSLVTAIQDGSISLPPQLSQDEVIRMLREGAAFHSP